MVELTKDQRIRKEELRMKKILSSLDKETKNMASSLVKNAAFMAVTLEDLQEQINENGVISEYQNGENQWGTKKSPEIDVYNSLIRNYALIVKTLTSLVPSGEQGQVKDGLMSFVMNKAKN